MCKKSGTKWILAIALAVGLGSTPAVWAHDSSDAAVYNFWDPIEVVGRSSLERNVDGLKARVKINASNTQSTHVYTLWFVVFNTPDGCATSPCSVADTFNPGANADFLFGGGTVTTDNKVEFGGSLATGDTSGSGMNEIGFPGLALGLTDPFNAEVMLAIHSHGPAGSGEVLAAQLSSFLGGCEVFLGPQGFAAGPQDVPDEAGECSTIMYSVHQP